MSDQTTPGGGLPGVVEPVQLEGIVERIVYENTDNGFFVARLRVEDRPEPVTFVGNLMAVSPGETIRIRGEWIDDKRFGRQVRVSGYETVLPSSVEGIEKYLGSGLIHGIGPAYAKRLVKAFGAETLRVIDEEPHRLRNVEGIGRKRAEQIREAWAEQRAIQSIMVFLQGHGVSTAQAVRIYKRYGDGAVAVLREDPYRLAEDIAGIGFAGADTIAHNLGIEDAAPQRLQAGMLHTLQQATAEGHCFLPADELVRRAAELLKVDADSLAAPLEALCESEAAVREDDRVYTRLLYDAETGVANELQRLLAEPAPEIEIHVENAIKWCEKRWSIELSPEQQDAIRRAADSKLLIVTGGPGTGKTTVIQSLIGIFERKNQSVRLAAPTGRAAKRMEEASKREAKTIHRFLEFSPNTRGFLRNRDNPIDADVVIVDEASMIDIGLMHALLLALPDAVRLIVVGDVDQLPSVGPGNVLVDLIASQRIPVVRLETVFRQAAESGIISNAHRINRGQQPEFNDRDFFFVERPEPAEALDTVLELVAQRIPKKFDLDPKRDIQVLAPVHRGEAGVQNLNRRLQEALNPGPAPAVKALRLGDKVIQTRNNYELEVFNGDIGTVADLHEESKEAHIQFEDGAVLYPYDEVDQLALAYAITIHKSQGSEYPAVVLPLMRQHYTMLQRNILYTAITRAKKLVIIVGDPKALASAVRNTQNIRRHTRLPDRLRR